MLLRMRVIMVKNTNVTADDNREMKRAAVKEV